MPPSRRSATQRIQQTRNSLTASTQSPFMFPLDVTSSFIYVHIVPHKIKPGQILKEGTVRFNGQEERVEAADVGSVLRQFSGGARARPVSENKVITERSIILPIPERLSDSLNVSYNTSDLGAAGAAFSAGQAIGTSEAGAATAGAGGYLARSAISQLGGKEVADIFSLSSQNVPNPFSTLMFKNVEQRVFDFSYTFSPRSEAETEALKKVINALRYLSLPGEDSFFLDFPYEFEISFVGSQYLYAFSRGYINDLTVDYGGDGGVSFFETTSGRGAAPTIVKLSFKFREIYPLSRDLIDRGSESMKVSRTFFEEEQTRQNSLPQPSPTSVPEPQTEQQRRGQEALARENASRYTGLGCVTLDTILFDGRKASEIEVGTELDTINPITQVIRKQIVTKSDTKVSMCVRITTESGIQLECSVSAPISDEFGNQVLAPKLLGVYIPVIDNGIHKIERVISVENIGVREIRHITVNGSFFPAGKEANRYILHHNKQ